MNLTYIPDNFLEGEVLAVILQAVDSSGGSNAQVTIAQVTLIELGLECTEVLRYTPIFQSRTRDRLGKRRRRNRLQGWLGQLLHVHRTRRLIAKESSAVCIRTTPPSAHSLRWRVPFSASPIEKADSQN